MNFEAFCNAIQDGQTVSAKSSMLFGFTNTRGEIFNLDQVEVRDFLTSLRDNNAEFIDAWNTAPSKKASFEIYEEKSYRKIYGASSNPVKPISTIGGSQTKSLTQLISKLVCFLGGLEYQGIERSTFFGKTTITKALENWDKTFSATTPSIKSNRNAFHAWLLRTGASERTATSYAHTGISIANKVLTAETKGAGKDLYQSNLAEVEAANQLLGKSSDWAMRNANGNGMYSAAMKKYIAFLKSLPSEISKPFLLLAGLSGTGKTRFVRRQAEAAGTLSENYCLVSVRPDWHEPADLLGYLSRLGAQGPEFVVTDALRFMVKAWKNSVHYSDGVLVQKPTEDVEPHWLCLDEMNLAPVEQYFADYLSVLETRKWEHGEYSCAPLLKSHVFTQLGEHGLSKLRQDLELEGDTYQSHWAEIKKNGVQLPFNLIVAGTVNMDETTHGFSRKVIDRALTLDFGNFFPNDFDSYFQAKTKPVPLTFPRLTAVTQSDFAGVAADKDGTKTVGFLNSVNAVLADTSFELAFRALNEILMSVACSAPQTDNELQAVWDDFLMTKVLPRIEGDEDKLSKVGPKGSEPLLPALQQLLETKLSKIWSGTRKDFYQLNAVDDSENSVACRTNHKLAWMQQRLEVNGFTSFWP